GFRTWSCPRSRTPEALARRDERDVSYRVDTSSPAGRSTRRTRIMGELGRLSILGILCLGLAPRASDADTPAAVAGAVQAPLPTERCTGPTPDVTATFADRELEVAIRSVLSLAPDAPLTCRLAANVTNLPRVGNVE